MVKAKLLFLKAVTRTKFFAILILISLLLGLLSGVMYSTTYEVSRSYLSYLFLGNVDSLYFVSLPESHRIRDKACDFQTLINISKYIDNANERIERLPQVKSSGWILNCYFLGYGNLGLIVIGYSDTKSMESIFHNSSDILVLLNNSNIDNTTIQLLEQLKLSYYIFDITGTAYADYMLNKKVVALIINLDTVSQDTILRLLVLMAQDERIYSSSIGSLIFLVDFNIERVLPANMTDVEGLIYGTMRNLKEAELSISSILTVLGSNIAGDIAGNNTSWKEPEINTIVNIPLRGLNDVYRVLNNISLYLVPLFVMIIIPILYILYISTREYSSMFRITIRRSMEIKGLWSPKYNRLFLSMVLTISVLLALIVGSYFHNIRAGVFSSIVTGLVVILGLVRGEDATYLTPKIIGISYALFLLYVILFVYQRNLLYLIGISPILSLIIPVLYWLRPFYTIPILALSIYLLNKLISIIEAKGSLRFIGINERLFLRIIKTRNFLVIAMTFTLSIATLDFVFPSLLIDYNIYRYAIVQDIVPIDALLYITENFLTKITHIYSILTAILLVSLVISITPSLQKVRVFKEIHGLNIKFPSAIAIMTFTFAILVVYIFTFISLSLFLKSYFYSLMWWG